MISAAWRKPEDWCRDRRVRLPRLGIPPSTLESKIRSMSINKHSFKR
jgi:hypothetical protein